LVILKKIRRESVTCDLVREGRETNHEGNVEVEWEQSTSTWLPQE